MDDTTNRRRLDNVEDDTVPESAQEHARAARDEWWESFATFLPREFVQHQRRARREMMLAWRSLLDRNIRRLDDRIERSRERERMDEDLLQERDQRAAARRAADDLKSDIDDMKRSGGGTSTV